MSTFLRMNVPMDLALREAISRARKLLGARSDAALLRILAGDFCRVRGIKVSGGVGQDPCEDRRRTRAVSP